MSSKVKKNILKLKESSTLVINEKSKVLISKGKKVYQFGFGQSPFPVPEKIVEALKKNGIYVLGVFSIFSYGLEIAKINFEKANQKYYSLSDFSRLIECSKKFTEISQDDIDKVNSWKKNPYDWIV